MQVIVSVYDSAVAAFSNPWYAPSLGAASRAFADEVNRSGSAMNAHPSDYVLFHLGSFDSETAHFEFVERPVQVIRAVDCLEKRNAS